MDSREASDEYQILISPSATKPASLAGCKSVEGEKTSRPSSHNSAKSETRYRRGMKRCTFIMEKFKALLFHLGLIFLCCVYVLAGAWFFYALERPLEVAQRTEAELGVGEEMHTLMSRAYALRRRARNFSQFATRFTPLLNAYQWFLFDEFQHPLRSNFYNALAYNNGTYTDMWSYPSAVLFTSTTVIPVGFGQVTPMTSLGRVALIIYSIIGLPLALMTLSDVGKFLCALFFKCFRNSISLTMLALTVVLLAYPCIGALLISWNTELSLADSYYFCLQCLFTIGFGDLVPAVTHAYLIVFIVVGVMLMTISIEVLASGIIHQIHFMGRQMGRVKHLAGRMAAALGRASRGQLIGMGLMQVNIFTRMGMMAAPGMQQGSTTNAKGKLLERTSSIAYEPKDMDFQFVDYF